MKVLQVLGRSAGGIARHVSQVVESLHGRDGLQIDVAAPAGLPLDIPRLVHPVSIPDGPLGHRAATSELKRIVARGGYEAVHAHGLRAGMDAGRAAGDALGLVTVHNLVQPEVAGRLRAPLYRVAERKAVRANDRVFAVSEQIAVHLRAGSPRLADRIEVLYLGIGERPHVGRTRDEVLAELGLQRQRLVVTVARLAPQKSLEVMLEAMARTEGCVLAILGEGPLGPRLEETSTRLGISDRVLFLGFRSDVHDVVAAADVFCLSSAWEGVPLAAQEAILLEVPIVSTHVGGMPELITDGVSGRLVPKGDAAALSAALREVLDQPEAARRLAGRALADLRTRFSTQRMLEVLAGAYRGAGRPAGEEGR